MRWASGGLETSEDDSRQAMNADSKRERERTGNGETNGR
jgi:hypothetical protein